VAELPLADLSAGAEGRHGSLHGKIAGDGVGETLLSPSGGIPNGMRQIIIRL